MGVSNFGECPLFWRVFDFLGVFVEGEGSFIFLPRLDKWQQEMEEVRNDTLAQPASSSSALENASLRTAFPSQGETNVVGRSAEKIRRPQALPRQEGAGSQKNSPREKGSSPNLA